MKHRVHRSGPVALAILLLAALLPSPVDAAVDFPDRHNTAGQVLVKMGESRYVYRYLFKLYDAALYTTDPAAGPGDLLSAGVPLRLQFAYHREIDRSIILKSAGRMLDRNLSPEERVQIADRVARLNEAYVSVREGDRSSLTFIPGLGTILEINGETAITIPGDDFAPLYFRIWLGEQPISESLKAELLGG